MKIAFITGARADYGPFRSTLKGISEEKNFNLDIIVHGMHLMKLYGNSVEEIKKDKFGKIIKLNTLKKDINKSDEMIKTIKVLHNFLKSSSYDLVILVGDRLETYAGAIASHFAKIPILHSGGGHITSGAVDNIYRFNITNFAKYHFTTSIKANDCLKNIPSINKDKLFFIGSPTVDAIKKFLKSPLRIELFVPDLLNKRYVLMTFHPLTLIKEPIVEILEASINFLMKKNISVLITYPNNDESSKDIRVCIDAIKKNKNVYAERHLGSLGYYTAIKYSEFIFGNSSSGIMEAPYFNKHVVNVGTRQEGRALDRSITNVSAKVGNVIKILNKLVDGKIRLLKNEKLYGNGTAVDRSIKILNTISIEELKNKN